MERGKKTGDSDSDDVEQQSLTGIVSGIVSDREAIDREQTSETPEKPPHGVEFNKHSEKKATGSSVISSQVDQIGTVTEDVEQQSLTGIVSDSEAIDWVHSHRFYKNDDSYDREAIDWVHSHLFYDEDDSYDREAIDWVHSHRFYKKTSETPDFPKLSEKPPHGVISSQVNQIGTVSEVVKMAKDAEGSVVMSQTSGETNDSFTADLSVGVIKSGVPCRGERLAKYNQVDQIGTVTEDVEQQSLTGIVSDREAIDWVHSHRFYDEDDSHDREAIDCVHSHRFYKVLDRAAEKQSLADISKPSETQSRADLFVTSKTPSLADMSSPSETLSRADLSVTSETPSIADFCESSESESRSVIHTVCYDQLAIQQLERCKEMLRALPITPEGVFQVTLKDSETIELLLFKFLNETLSVANNRQGFIYIFEERTTVFNDSVGYHVMVDPVKRSKLDATLTTRLIRAILEPTIIKKRSLYYLNSYLFGGNSTKGLLSKIDRIVDLLCCTFKCTRASLGITASSEGLVYGDLRMVIGDTLSDFKHLKGGTSIPSDSQEYEISSHHARFILIVEKDTVFTKIIEADFVNRFRCILITGKGTPDVSTRVFVRRLREQLNIPVFALVDCNVYGFRILSCYKHGSIKMSYDNARLATPDIKWLGILPTELEKHKLLWYEDD